ncbi:hypothetical protein BJX64DRAFT_160715 [Aspergillus heterothallicus]
MARLNTRSQVKQNEQLRERSKPQHLTERQATPQNSKPSTPKERQREQWPTERPTTLARSKSTRTRTKTLSDQQFDIFADSDGLSERDTPKGKKAIPLKLGLARANSMILPIPQQPRARTNRKSELYNYDKENDPAEEELDPEPPSLSRNPSDASSTRSPARNRSTQHFTAYRQLEPESDNESDNDSINSLDDFIVSDNDEISYHGSEEEDETDEEQHKVATPPTQKRRLFRGRRPTPATDLENVLRESARRPDLRLEPSLPAAIATPSSRLNGVSRSLFQTDVSEKMNKLRIEDDGASTQLQNGLFGAIEEQDRQLQPDDLIRTPPSSPSKSCLRSPMKERICIPPTPHRESHDAFWSAEVTNNWIDEHSPRKTALLLREFDRSDSESESMTRRFRSMTPVKPLSKAAQKKAESDAKKAALARKRSFDSKKGELAEHFLKTLDDAVCEGKVQRYSAETGGVRIIWSKTLQTTAGRASWKRDRSSASSSSSSDTSVSTATTRHFATIELAERIIDDEDRLINTMAHE